MPTQGNLFIENLYQVIEQEMLQNIGKIIGNGKGITVDGIPHWQVEKLSQLGRLNDQQLRVLSRYANLTTEQVQAFIQENAIAEIAQFDADLDEAGDGVLLYQEPTDSIYERLQQLQENAKELTNRINSSLLSNSEQVYRDIITESAAKVLTGNKTLTQALQETASKWSQTGIPLLVDKAGRQWSTEAYVSMVLRNTRKDVANNVQESKMDEYDVDLVEASSHAGSRPSHLDYQGRIYSRSGKSKRYPSLHEDTTYGQGYDGFVTGIHCGHRLFIYVQGLSTRRYQPYDKAESLEQYQDSQKQRHLEREIRRSKKELAMLKEMGMDEETISQAKKKVAQKQQNMRSFIHDTDRTRRREREQIVTHEDMKKPKSKEKKQPLPPKPMPKEKFQEALVDKKRQKETKQIIQKAIKEPKYLTGKEVDALKGKKLRETARDIALAFHSSGKTGISYGNFTVEQVVNSMLINQSDAALRKDIKSMQRKLKEWGRD